MCSLCNYAEVQDFVREQFHQAIFKEQAVFYPCKERTN